MQGGRWTLHPEGRSSLRAGAGRVIPNMVFATVGQALR